jgi:glutamate--cysteine ligase
VTSFIILKTLNTQRLQLLLKNKKQTLIKTGLKGIEKESLRLSNKGIIAHTAHPHSLGSALTHPHITTDYSESLLEFITPPFANIDSTLAFMQKIHQFVYHQLADEFLLASSMPCGIDGDESIPIAQYGHSNIGQMKHIYRQGLAHRYGRTMQTIAGIHFNYSVPEKLWPVLHQLEGSPLSLNEFKSSAYFDLIRNFQRQGWLILYLFGASPAMCKNFFSNRPSLIKQFDEFDDCTLYLPNATSLRMSDIGYKSNNQTDLNIDYNSLDGYVDSLSAAMNTPYPEYQKFGIKIDGQYQQLNSNILQIENEFYSTIRPKQIISPYEKPTLALKRRGVHYVEIRSLDLNPFNAIGIDATQSRFIEAFLLSCLLQDSPKSSHKESYINNHNQLHVAHHGRQNDLKLIKHKQPILLKDWAYEILNNMQTVCDILDADENDDFYTQALNTQRKLIKDPDLTPSAQLLSTLRNAKISFTHFANAISQKHGTAFKTQKLSDKDVAFFTHLSKYSHKKQTEIEDKDNLSLDDFLIQYFSQT